MGEVAKIEPPAVIDLPHFQVQGMLCGDGMIQLAAFDSTYTIELDAMSRPMRYDSSPLLDRGHVPPQFVGQWRNLGASNVAVKDLKPVRIALGMVAGGGQYLLEMNANATSSGRCPRILTTTRIVRTDRNGREVQQFQIFRGPGIRECGE